MFALPEGLKPVDGYCANVGAAGAITGRYVSLKFVHKAYVVIKYRQADGVAIVWHIKRATNVAAGSATPVTSEMRIWSNLDCATSDLLVERTPAATYSSGTGAGTKLVIFELDASALPEGFDCVSACSTTDVAAGQYVDITYYLDLRYPGQVSTQLSVLTD